jgi:acid phosphatase type 7
VSLFVKYFHYLLFHLFITSFILSSWGYALETRGPYLTELTSIRAVIVFHTENDYALELRMYENGNSVPTNITSLPGKVHTFYLDGLKPQTKYNYIIMDSHEPKSDLTGNHQFQTPAPDLTEFSFVVYGDSRDRSSEPKRHKLVSRNFLSHDPLFIVHTGDMLLGGDNHQSMIFNQDWQANFFDPLRGIVDKIPFYLTSGNHDEDAMDSEAVLKSAFPVYRESFQFAFTKSDVHFIFLHVPNQMKEFQAQRQWFKGELEKARDCAWRIVFLHVSPITNGKYRDYQWTLEGRDAFLRTCLDHKADLVISGHDHSYQRFVPLKQNETDSHAVQFLVTGLAGTNPYHADENEFTAKIVNKTDHFCVVKVAPEKLIITAYNNENKPFDQFTMLKKSTERGKIFGQ